MINATASNFFKVAIVIACFAASAHAEATQALFGAPEPLQQQTNGLDVTHSIGIARNTDDQTIRYIEHHQYFKDGTHLVRYFDNDRQLILEKDLTYPGMPQHPVIVQRNVRSNVITTVTQDALGQLATITRSDADTFSFKLSEDIIIGAGFDRFIQENWDQFKQNPTRSVRFAVPRQTRLLKMQITRLGLIEGQSHFTIKPENWFVRLILPKISLVYSEDQMLKRYQGFSNLKPTQDKSRDVIITFRQYNTDRAMDRFPEEWMAVAAEYKISGDR
jgi:hypothetical protein